MGKNLVVSPNDVLKFIRSSETPSTLKLQNTSNDPITFKIQTTSPQKFRVRPRFGVLKRGESTTINILLKKDENLKDGSVKDKFLVRALKIPPNVDQCGSMITFWKQIPANCSSVEEHQVICEYDDSSSRSNKALNKQPSKPGLNKQRSKLGKGLTKSISFIKITDYEYMAINEPDGDNINQAIAGMTGSRSGQSPGNNLRGGDSYLSKGQSSGNVKQNKMERQLWRTQVTQYITIFLLFILAVGFGYLVRKQIEFDPKAQIEEALRAEEALRGEDNYKCRKC
ncbi:vesicle-associated membrane protein-associated protein A-like [Teleopsis dalmanni]|uniref:vesicle-associated membrane protein-associated protein A-like n=1 Tax=Teleopsis dalmanni TaxID=139649 RepID=UPI0018CD7863|nr:vesicle-associated membrane protein-associated protein A-like [Teleopsis dalmanni]XP_037943263.1 vesicle-associated membrane protein-associated protein A-like [Teleopsis dalmanni]